MGEKRDLSGRRTKVEGPMPDGEQSHPQPAGGNQPDLVGASQPADSARLRESMARLFDIYRDISEKADEVIAHRCPYKNAQSRCTASFGCRNQYFTKVPRDLPICTGSDKLDYRSAWDA